MEQPNESNKPSTRSGAEPRDAGPLPTRRAILGGIGAGAAVLGTPGIAAAQGRERNGQARRDDAGPERFIRMFHEHPPFADADDELRVMLAELGRPGGILDADDPLEVGPEALFTDDAHSANNPDNPNHTAGVTFLGQFLDHDITSDSGSTLGHPSSVQRSLNLRSARLDLDSVYGGGPSQSPQLYEPNEPGRFRIESGGRFEDLPRDGSGQAIIADSRNDENLIISGLHCAFLKFHNAILERSRRARRDRAFEHAQRLVRQHYQWIVLREVLPQFVGQTLVDDILANGRQFYTASYARIPVEFQVAAFRMGHSMIRPSYRANMSGNDGDPFFAFVFDPSTFGDADPDDLSGGHRAPRRFVDWQTFFDFGDGEAKPNKLIDTRLSTPLFQLPLGTISTQRGEPIGPTSLATRNLLRHITWGIPSGQDIAGRMNVDRLTDADLDDINTIAPRLRGNTPLWLYILREAELIAGGRHLGPVGGRIVAEVFIGILQLDPTSILSQRSWRPILPTRNGPKDFRMNDLLHLAGVSPSRR